MWEGIWRGVINSFLLKHNHLYYCSPLKCGKANKPRPIIFFLLIRKLRFKSLKYVCVMTWYSKVLFLPGNEIVKRSFSTADYCFFLKTTMHCLQWKNRTVVRQGQSIHAFPTRLWGSWHRQLPLTEDISGHPVQCILASFPDIFTEAPYFMLSGGQGSGLG